MIRPLALALLLAGCAADAGRPTDSPPDAASGPVPADSVADWSAHFAAEGAAGTFVLYDTASGRTVRHAPERAAARFSPASTSKVFNALVFLDQGVVSDVDSLFAWDGVERSIEAWNRDHSLRSGVQHSAVWLFQRLAQEVGREGYADVFARQPFGNATMGEPLEMSWLDGTWRISADEQVAFLDALRRGELAFSAEDQATVRGFLPVLDEAEGAVLKGKTGWGLPDGEPAIGWIVGWVERPEGDVVYAMNAEEAPGETFDVGPARLRIVRSVLEAAGVWSAEARARP